jgi:hypothetical protein
MLNNLPRRELIRQVDGVSGPGQGDEEDVELTVTMRVASPMHGCPQLRFVLRVPPGDELGVGLERFATALDDAGEGAVPGEHDERELRVVPRLVAEQLAERLGEPGRAGPELALGDEQVAVLVRTRISVLPATLNASATPSMPSWVFSAVRSTCRRSSSPICANVPGARASPVPVARITLRMRS